MLVNKRSPLLLLAIVLLLPLAAAAQEHYETEYLQIPSETTVAYVGSNYWLRATLPDNWAYGREIALHFIRPGKPVENAFIESFNGSLRDECLNANWFHDLDEARQVIEDWRLDYNEVRPHSSLGHLPPAMYMAGGSQPSAS